MGKDDLFGGAGPTYDDDKMGDMEPGDPIFDKNGDQIGVFDEIPEDEMYHEEEQQSMADVFGSLIQYLAMSKNDDMTYFINLDELPDNMNISHTIEYNEDEIEYEEDEND